jgi:hypothetical protein
MFMFYTTKGCYPERFEKSFCALQFLNQTTSRCEHKFFGDALTCNEDGFITSLLLPGDFLTGTIGDVLQSFASLTKLDL